MSYKISKELFEAVMDGYEYISPHNGGIIYCWKDSDGLHNEKVIYPNDFFFKCKEWALEQGYWIQSGLRGTGGGFAEFGRFNDGVKYINSLGYTDSEQQAVFDACQWILGNKDKE